MRRMLERVATDRLTAALAPLSLASVNMSMSVDMSVALKSQDTSAIHGVFAGESEKSR